LNFSKLAYILIFSCTYIVKTNKWWNVQVFRNIGIIIVTNKRNSIWRIVSFFSRLMKLQRKIEKSVNKKCSQTKKKHTVVKPIRFSIRYETKKDIIKQTIISCLKSIFIYINIGNSLVCVYLFLEVYKWLYLYTHVYGQHK